jgi:tRNA (guanine37-N1)-methyltransferase
MVTFTVITIFPKMLDSALGHGLLKKAQEKGLIKVEMVNLRDYTTDRHHTTDDYPYGGGQGMVMKPEPLVAAIEDIRRQTQQARIVLLAPQGRVLSQQDALRLSQQERIALICGRYEGIDERVKTFVDEEISIGDYTLTGGEPAAAVVIDAVARLVPGVLGNENSATDESFVDGFLEYPQYTRPEIFRGMNVPEVLLSGDHERIKQWRRQKSLEITRKRRPDLFARARDKLEAAVRRSTAIATVDIHDIARASRTYGVRGFFVVIPVKPLQKLARKIIEHWQVGYGSEYNVTRKEALSLTRICDTLDDAVIAIERETGEKPVMVVTSARAAENRTSFEALRDMLHKEIRPFLILFGTGWGLTEAIFAQSDYVLEPIAGGEDYNHLSVRSAAAIVLDRLLGRH